MISDASFTFSVGQSLGVAGPNGTFILPATSSMDLVADRNIGDGLSLHVRFRVRTAFTAGSGTPRLHPCIVYSDSASLLTNPTIVSMVGGANYILTTDGGIPGGLVASALSAGQTFYLPIPLMSEAVSGLTSPNHLQRYMGIVYFQLDYVGNYFSAGAIDADLVQAPKASMTDYPAGTSF